MLYKVVKSFLFRFNPEQAHHMTFTGLNLAARIPGGLSVLRSMYDVKSSEILAQQLFGCPFPNPFGLGAGLDKNGTVVPAFSAIGFGFLEVGTVTPKPQPGNEQPRLFRLVEDEALINRMGFNNEGTEVMLQNLTKAAKHRTIPVAVNIGKNKLTPNEVAAEDYRICIRDLYDVSDFFVVNISSPNTPDLRKLQHGEDLKQLLFAVKEEVAHQANNRKNAPKDVLVKIAPDLSEEELETIVATIVDSGMSGIIATNTTLARDGLKSPHAQETGGLSGIPLAARSTEVIRQIYKQTQGKIPIIGSGGVFTAEQAYEKIKAGASLVEIYTALIYKGPGLLRALNRELASLLQRDGYTHISEAVGSDVRSL